MSLGLKRGTVELVPHNPKWQQLFEEEKKLLTDTFGGTVIAIEHVGSTAVPGLMAKPILDMNIAVASLEVALGMKDKFEKLSYEHRPFKPGHTKEGLREQELYVKGPEEKRTHHAHVITYNSNSWKNDLFFRDYLRKHKEVASEYAGLKRKLAAEYKDDRYAYTDKKREFIKMVLSRRGKVKL